MNTLLAAISGWGKSYLGQHLLETNIEAGTYESVVVLDYKDEFRGLVKAGLTNWHIVGSHEMGAGKDAWRDALEREPMIVLARHDNVDEAEWRDVAGRIVAAGREAEQSTLFGLDEAHWLAPQKGRVPASIKGLATTGRGEGNSGIWLTQRLAELEETCVSQAQQYILGGLGTKSDRNKVGADIEYPQEALKPGGVDVPDLPDGLEASDAGKISVRKWTTGEGENRVTTGSEWMRTDDEGLRQRLNSRDVEMKSTHHGPEGQRMTIPDSLK